MKVNVLRINDENLNDNESTYYLDYNTLIRCKFLRLTYLDGITFTRGEVKEIYQDDFNYLRITTVDGLKFIIAPSKPINLDKDLKTQQVKYILEKLNEKYVIFIEVKNNNFLLSYIDDDSFETRLYSKDNESLEDFILRVGKAIVNNK